METTTTRISVETKKRLKVYAATNDTSMLDVLERAISLVIDGLPDISPKDMGEGIYLVRINGSYEPVSVYSWLDGMCAERLSSSFNLELDDWEKYEFKGPVPVPMPK